MALICHFAYAQQIDSTFNNQYIQKLIHDEVQKELLKEKELQKAQPRKLFGDRIRFSGSALLRAAEWDLHQNGINPSSGITRKDHNRFWSRFNFFLAVDSDLSETVSVNARIRTGNNQYSFVTFGENLDERLRIILDEFWIQWKPNNYVLRAGRQTASRIWSNQQGSQFDVPKHDGVTLMKEYDLNPVKLTPKVGYFVEYYRNNSSFKDQGRVFGGALAASLSQTNTVWTAETGFIKAEQLPNRYLNDIAETSNGIGVKYHDGDLAPTYAIWTNQIGVVFKNFHNLSFKFDYYHNLANYKQNPISNMIYDKNGFNSFSNPDDYNNATAPNFTKQKQGFVASVSIGNLAKPKNFWFEASYLYMEKYAAMDYFAQYDYSRWASTNIKGPEFGAGYRFNNYLMFRAKYFITQEIKGLDGIDPSYRRSANRLRLDFVMNF